MRKRSLWGKRDVIKSLTMALVQVFAKTHMHTPNPYENIIPPKALPQAMTGVCFALQSFILKINNNKIKRHKHTHVCEMFGEEEIRYIRWRLRILLSSCLLYIKCPVNFIHMQTMNCSPAFIN